MIINKDLKNLLMPLTLDWVFNTKFEFYECVKNFIKSFDIIEFDELTENELLRVACELRGIKFEALNKDGELMYVLNKGENFRKLITNKSTLIKINDIIDNSDYKELISNINLKYSVHINENISTLIIQEKNKFNNKNYFLSFRSLSKEQKTGDLFFKEVIFNIGLDKFQFLNLVDDEIQSIKEIENFDIDKFLIKNITLKECSFLIKNYNV